MKRLFLTLLVFCVSFTFPEMSFSQGFANSPWPMVGHDPAHTHRGISAPPATNILKWKFKAESLIYTPSIGADGTIYAGSFDKNVYAINPDGTLKWKYEVDSPIRKSSPAIGNDGTIYVCSPGTDNDSSCFLYALNPDGTLKWKYKNDRSFNSSPVIGYDGVIFIASYDGYVYSLNSDGTLIWKYKAYAIDSPAIGKDGTVYIASEESTLYAIDPDGSLKWKHDTHGVPTSSPSIGDDGTLYMHIHETLMALKPDGSYKWSLPLWYIRTSPAVAADGTIYIGSGDFNLYAVNPDSTLKWKFPTGGVIYQAAAIGSDGCIYVPADEQENHFMYAVNPDGTLRWKYSIGWATTPVIGADGTLYFGSDIGYLCALAPESPSSVTSSPLSFSVKDPRPNPFNPSTTIEYTLSAPTIVKLNVYSVTGQKVATLVDGKMRAGTHTVVFDGKGCASGLYVYQFESAVGRKNGKMLLVK